ncbi:MAG: hypothetical protein P3B98_07700 [Gemmatimonadota bacterium]|nr:hypothetical protein [Gemmatimonadota bacterium]
MAEDRRRPGGGAPDAEPTEVRTPFSEDEQRALREAFAAGTPARCPRCATAMTARAIGGGSFGLGYARRREWLMCPTCRRSVMFDIARGTRN